MLSVNNEDLTLGVDPTLGFSDLFIMASHTSKDKDLCGLKVFIFKR